MGINEKGYHSMKYCELRQEIDMLAKSGKISPSKAASLRKIPEQEKGELCLELVNEMVIWKRNHIREKNWTNKFWNPCIVNCATTAPNRDYFQSVGACTLSRPTGTGSPYELADKPVRLEVRSK